MTINVEIIKGHAGQILSCGWVTGNKEFTIGGLKTKFHFCKRQVANKQSASVIWGLIRLIILDRKGISRGVRVSDAHAFRLLLCSQGILLCKS